MNRSSVPSFAAELRVSPRPMLGLLLVPALALTLAAWRLPDPDKAMNFALLLYAFSVMAWILTCWKLWLGRWATIIGLVAIIQAVQGWLGVPGFLALLAIPTALAAALSGLYAAAITAIGESLLLLLLPMYIPTGTSGAETGIALAAVWITLGVTYGTFRPVHQLAQWSLEHFERAQELLEEARDRQAELKDALDALAHANRQLALTNEKLAAMRLVAEEAQKTKAAFVANVSHEFRTPLNIIVGLAEIMVDAPEVYGVELPPNTLRDLRILYRNCEHLSSMINDVLDLSQVEAGRLALHKERVALMGLIDSALTVVHPLLDKKGLHLQVSVPRDLPDVYCDPTRIRQVILNLVSNAARFTEEGSITIRVDAQDQHVIVSVADTGPGISPEDAERIFEPFQQASKPWRQRNGSGLGLSISKRFVELHEGRMWLESELGVGSKFSFKLPLFPLIGPSAPPQRWITEGWVKRSVAPQLPIARLDQRMILCDETGELYPVFSRYADRVEFVDIRDIAQVPEALQQSAAQAVVINTRSPDELCPLIMQASERMPDMPIIGCSLPPKTAHAAVAGAMGYLLKPIKRVDLEEALGAVDRSVKRVLVVDDEEDALWLLARMLRACDSTLEITTASSGAQALAELRGSRPPDLMLLDILMPDMDGWQVLAVKAQDVAIRDIPVTIISAQDPQDRPMSSEFVAATMGGGLSISKLLRCSRALSALLLQPDREPDPELV